MLSYLRSPNMVGRLLACLALLIVAMVPASAADVTFTELTVASATAGGAMLTAAGGSLSGFIHWFANYGFLIVLVIGGVVALFGYSTGRKEALITGLVLFIAAAIIKGLIQFI